jgi:hypothetical protein
MRSMLVFSFDFRTRLIRILFLSLKAAQQQEIRFLFPSSRCLRSSREHKINFYQLSKLSPPPMETSTSMTPFEMHGHKNAPQTVVMSPGPLCNRRWERLARFVIESTAKFICLPIREAKKAKRFGRYVDDKIHKNAF